MLAGVILFGVFSFLMGWLANELYTQYQWHKEDKEKWTRLNRRHHGGFLIK